MNHYCIYDSHDPIFDLNGFWWLEENQGSYERLPISAYPRLSEILAELSRHNSGGFLRFRTNSNLLYLEGELLSCNDMNHFPRVGVSGLDVYCDGSYMTSVSGAGEQLILRAEIPLPKDGMRDILIYFPLYNGLKYLKIGIQEQAVLEKAQPMTYEKPVVFYGSSITQGGCASRPGNCYTNLLSRWLDTKIINLGFSGNAKGETEMAERIAEIDMSVFVMDYDYNSVTEELARNHYPFYRIIREKHPELPIIMISKANRPVSIPVNRGDEVIYNTYHRAKAEGDQNVFFLSGEPFYEKYGKDTCTVDNCHPNDLGFYCMAKAVQPLLSELLERGLKK